MFSRCFFNKFFRCFLIGFFKNSLMRLLGELFKRFDIENTLQKRVSESEGGFLRGVDLRILKMSDLGSSIFASLMRF